MQLDYIDCSDGIQPNYSRFEDDDDGYRVPFIPPSELPKYTVNPFAQRDYKKGDKVKIDGWRGWQTIQWNDRYLIGVSTGKKTYHVFKAQIVDVQEV